jgi:hypothetical protein
MELIIIISLVAASWIISGYAADGYALRKHNKKYGTLGVDNGMDYELYKHIRKVVDYSYDCEREHYIEAYGEESNNYLWLDSDLDLHLEQHDNNHIFKSLCYLEGRLSPADQYRLWRRNSGESQP